MKVFRITDEVSQEYEGCLNFNDKTEKSVEKLSGDGKWKFLHGIKLMIDPAGVIIKGPDIFIGRKWDDLTRLNFQDTFTVMRSVARAMGETNKSCETDDDRLEKKELYKKAVNELNGFIERSINYEKSRIK
jgi:hypothetical protein